MRPDVVNVGEANGRLFRADFVSVKMSSSLVVVKFDVDADADVVSSSIGDRSLSSVAIVVLPQVDVEEYVSASVSFRRFFVLSSLAVGDPSSSINSTSGFPFVSFDRFDIIGLSVVF